MFSNSTWALEKTIHSHWFWNRIDEKHEKIKIKKKNKGDIENGNHQVGRQLWTYDCYNNFITPTGASEKTDHSHWFWNWMHANRNDEQNGQVANQLVHIIMVLHLLECFFTPKRILQSPLFEVSENCLKFAKTVWS